jgi:hypothetical protein
MHGEPPGPPSSVPPASPSRNPWRRPVELVALVVWIVTILIANAHPGRESLYWLCLGTGELLVLAIGFVPALR